jgi:hypothetical protein
MRRILLGLATTVFLGLCLVTVLIFISLHGAADGRSQVGPARACDLAAASPHDLARPSGNPGIGADDIDLAASASECEAALAKAPQDPRLLFETGGVADVGGDADKARTLYEQAAGQGYAAAQVRRGEFYDQGAPYGQLDLAYFYENGRGGLPRDSEEATRLYELAVAQGVKDQTVRAAPTTAAKNAYDYLEDHYTSNGIINYSISTYDNNVCHLRYLFFAESDFNIKYDFDAADIRLDTVKSVPPRQGGALGIGFAGIDLDAAPGRHFKADGRIKRASLPPAASSIRLLATIQPDAAMVQALVKLATECRAKPPPSSVVQ